MLAIGIGFSILAVLAVVGAMLFAIWIEAGQDPATFGWWLAMAGMVVVLAWLLGIFAINLAKLLGGRD